MLGKTGTPVAVSGEYFILLESNIVLLYILDTVVNNQNIIFQGSVQTQNPKVPCILSRVERKDKTINNQRGNQEKQWNNIIQDDRQLYQWPWQERVITENFNEAIKGFMGSSSHGQ